ncbi:phycobilisome protein [Synechocystis salina]|uniref:Phycobilisome protein n=1 Tax=Synechocystis salina LEGE 00031 TaxID=1828736 RepID=A0ABR9VMX4_9SYNC|nr:phycobilisome protein [Synechocystis salina]MBE9239648.1 phycobilisome protein [Synechocystis salina LEGE 00041]MBE9252687.1 phycobilisome protein [Synechocystis salina LEGE 00031]
MQKDFERLFHRAEDHYLHPLEIISFRKNLGLMQERLNTYRLLRDGETILFQAIADQLEMEFNDAPVAQLHQALLHWISILRYGAMAMLLSNPEYLQYRLLEWLEGVVQAHEMVAMETRVSELLKEQLQSLLEPLQYHLLEPFLAQADQTILGQAPAPAPEEEAEMMTLGE